MTEGIWSKKRRTIHLVKKNNYHLRLGGSNPIVGTGSGLRELLGLALESRHVSKVCSSRLNVIISCCLVPASPE